MRVLITQVITLVVAVFTSSCIEFNMFGRPNGARPGLMLALLATMLPALSLGHNTRKHVHMLSSGPACLVPPRPSPQVPELNFEQPFSQITAAAGFLDVCTLVTPGTQNQGTCGRFTLLLGTYEHGSHYQTPGKAVVKLGQQIYPSSPFTFARGTQSAVCEYNMASSSITLGSMRQRLSSSGFRNACPANIRV